MRRDLLCDNLFELAQVVKDLEGPADLGLVARLGAGSQSLRGAPPDQGAGLPVWKDASQKLQKRYQV